MIRILGKKSFRRSALLHIRDDAESLKSSRYESLVVNRAPFSQEPMKFRVSLCIEQFRKVFRSFQIVIAKRKAEASFERMKSLWRSFFEHTRKMQVCFRSAVSVYLLCSRQLSQNYRVLGFRRSLFQ